MAQIIPNALPLGQLQKAHNGVDPATAEIDPRFAPLIIAVKREWLAKMPEPYKTRFEESLTWTADTKWPEMHWTTPAFFTEWALRHYCHKGAMDDAAFAALEAYLVENYADMNMCARSMGKVVDGRMVVDMTTSSGPFYLDSVACIDKHYATRCRNLRPDQIP